MKSFAEVVGLESVACVLSDDESDVAVGVIEAVIVAATETGVGVVKIVLAPPAVTVGTLFWRYSRGCKAFSMSVASDRTVKRRKKAYAEAPGWNMIMRRCFGRKKSKPGGEQTWKFSIIRKSRLCSPGTRTVPNDRSRYKGSHSTWYFPEMITTEKTKVVNMNEGEWGVRRY